MAAAVWRRGHLRRPVGVGPESHPDHGQGPDANHTLQVSRLHTQAQLRLGYGSSRCLCCRELQLLLPVWPSYVVCQAFTDLTLVASEHSHLF